MPTATLDFTHNDQNDSTVWTLGQAAHPTLSAVSVFDAHTASIHVTQTNDVAYTPLPLKMLAELSRACDEVKTRLTSEIAALQQQVPAVISQPGCKADTAVGKLIAGLNATTAPADIEALAGLGAEAQAELELLNADLSADPVLTARRLIALKAKIEGGAAKLAVLAAAITDVAADELRTKFGDFTTARAAAAAASAALFAREPLPNVGSEVWRALWEAARTYSDVEAYPGRAFPVTEAAACVLCQQDLAPAAADRMTRFEAFVKDESKRREALAKLAYEAALASFEGAVPSRAEVAEIVARIRDDLADEMLAQRTRKSTTTARWRHRLIKRLHSADAANIYLEGQNPPLDELRQHAEALGSARPRTDGGSRLAGARCDDRPAQRTGRPPVACRRQG